MDISCLQLRALPPALVSTTSSLPPGPKSPIALGPAPEAPRNIIPLRGDAGDITAGMFGHFAATWEHRLHQFLTDDPISRA
jgi:hypothetical protein